MMNKLTNAMALATAIEVLSTDNQYDAVIEKLQKMQEQLEKKKAYKGSGKPTKTQVLNEGLKEEILNVMEVGERYTVTEITKMVTTEMSNQKASALLKQLAETNKVKRDVDKRKTYFTLITED